MIPISIPANTALYKAGSLMLIAGAIPLADASYLIVSGAMTTHFAAPITLIMAAGCYGMIAGLVDLLKWNRSRNIPALLLTEDGITDATGIVTGGLIRWEEVASVSTIHRHGKTSLALQLTDNAGYVSRLPRWKRWLLSTNVSICGTPFLVSESELAVPAEQARITIESARSAYGTRGARESAPRPSSHWWTAVPPEERTVTPLCYRR